MNKKAMVNKIKHALKEKSMTYDDFADLTGVTRKAIDRRLSPKGNGVLSVKWLQEVAPYLGLDYREILQAGMEGKSVNPTPAYANDNLSELLERYYKAMDRIEELHREKEELIRENAELRARLKGE